MFCAWQAEAVSGMMLLQRRRPIEAKSSATSQGFTMASTQTENWGYRLGRASMRALGNMRMWVRYLAMQLTRRGIPAGLATILAWALVIAVAGVSFYLVFWVALIALAVVCAVAVVSNLSASSIEEWDFASQEDHRQSPFYHPDNFTDDPDPRFDELDRK